MIMFQLIDKNIWIDYFKTNLFPKLLLIVIILKKSLELKDLKSFYWGFCYPNQQLRKISITIFRLMIVSIVLKRV